MQVKFVTQLQDMARKWLQDCSTINELLDVITLKQFINTLDTNVHIWVPERKP